MSTLKNTVVSSSPPVMPVGTSAQRPTNPLNGDLRFNTSRGYPEVFYNGNWVDANTGYGTIITTGLTCWIDAYASRTDHTVSDGTMYTDLSGNGNHFYVSGTSAVRSSSFPEYVELSESNHMYCANVMNQNYITVECVFQKFGDSGEDILWNKENVWETKTDAYTISNAVYTAATGWFWYSTGATINANQSYHYAITYGGGNVYSYLNGVQISNYTYTASTLNQASTAATSYPKLNARNDGQTTRGNPGSHRYYHFAIYNRQLTDREISHNASATMSRFQTT